MNNPSIASKRIMLTGGAGFLGSFVTEKLKARGCKDIFIPKEQDYDLTNLTAIKAAFQDVGKLFSASPDFRPSTFDSRPPLDIVIHLAATHLPGVEKFVALGTICAYPKFAPEETNAPYGLAKKMLLVQSQAYRQQNMTFLLAAAPAF